MSRRTRLELDLMNAALETLKSRYGYEGYHLAGQSGGSRIISGLIGLRRDIACAVMGSGPLTSPDERKSSDPGRAGFDPTEKIAELAQNRALRPYLVSDKSDKRVPVAQQTGFAVKLRRAGRQVPEFFVDATDELHHGVLSYTELVAAGCVLDRPEEEITRALATLDKRSAEYNQRRRKETADKASILAAARQSAPDTSVAAAGKK
jgi:hypothetical protein